MKKTLLILLLIIVAFTKANSQESKIKIRDQITLGSRVLSVDPSCSPNISAFDKQSEKFLEIRPCLNLSILKYKTNEQKDLYVLSLVTLSQQRLTITVGSRLLLKSTDGNILELKAMDEQSSKYGSYKSLFRCSFLIIPEYVVTKEDLDWFCKNRVQKFRIEYFQGYADADIKPEYDMGFSSFICNAQEAFQKKIISNDNPIYDDF